MLSLKFSILKTANFWLYFARKKLEQHTLVNIA